MRSINSDTSNHLTSEGFMGWSGAVIVAARTSIIRLLTLEREGETFISFITSADSSSSTCPGKCCSPEGGVEAVLGWTIGL